MNRELLSACYAGMLSVPSLCRDLQSKGFAMVKDFADWRPQLRQWLQQSGHFPQTSQPFEPDPHGAHDDTAKIETDPPLPFFVLFEAEQAAGGRHLGPLGSIIVAETMLGAMRANPLRVPGSTLRDRIKNCALALFNMPEPEQATTAGQPVQQAVTEALAEIGELETMPDLLGYMAGQRMFD